MGFRDASAPFSGRQQFRRAGERTADLAAEHSPARVIGRGTSAAISRIAVRLLLLGIRFYQVMLAPIMISVCKFYPSCSHYAAEAIERHGARRGLRLAIARLWRCRPFTHGGHDPVPDVDELQPEEESLDEARA